MKNIAVIGAGGAIGSAFIENLSNNDEVEKIYAFSSSSKKFASNKVIAKEIDILDEKSIKTGCDEINEELDLVLVTIGILHDENLMPEKSIRDLKKENFEKVFAINTIAPALLAKYFLLKLNKKEKAIFAAISARVGSISDNHLGGWYAYRSSKSALNMLLKNFSIEMARKYKNMAIIGLHPGTVNSKLSEPFQGAVAEGKLFTPEFSAQKMLEVIAKIDAKDSGKVFDWKGEIIEY